MPSLTFRKEFIDPILYGEKTATFRLPTTAFHVGDRIDAEP